jgi:hypothetical protein
MQSPTLRDPHAGIAGAPAYLLWWGESLYHDWCELKGVTPLPYAEFRDRTLREGKDWWTIK